MADNDQNDDLDENEDTEETEESTEDTEDTEESKDPPEGDAKRIADLIKARDKADARANKAESALREAGAGKSGAAGSNDPAVKALMAELREASLDAVFGDYPALKEYGIDRALIEGSTRTEMKASADALVGLIKSVTTKARNKALADAGITAEPAGASRKPPVDFAAMKDEDFQKYLDNLDI